MNTTSKGPIIVGVTGVGENSAALRFAADSALRRGCRVVVVHAAHFSPSAPPSPLITDDSLRRLGERIVREVLDELHDISVDSVDAVGTTRLGQPVPELVELSRGASLLILQHRDLRKVHRILTGSIAAGVAAHAYCPVVSVPESWSFTRQDRVTVGVDESGGPKPVLESALIAAAERKAALRVMHAWRMNPAYEDLFGARVNGEWRLRSEQHLRAAIEESVKGYADVSVDVDVRHEWPAEALQKAAAESDLLVLGRRTRHLPWGPVLGSLTRALLREASCPVQVVPYPSTDGNEGLAGFTDEVRPQA